MGKLGRETIPSRIAVETAAARQLTCSLAIDATDDIIQRVSVDAEAVRHLFAGLAFHHALEHVAFPVGQAMLFRGKRPGRRRVGEHLENTTGDARGHDGAAAA